VKTSGPADDGSGGGGFGDIGAGMPLPRAAPGPLVLLWMVIRWWSFAWALRFSFAGGRSCRRC